MTFTPDNKNNTPPGKECSSHHQDPCTSVDARMCELCGECTGLDLNKQILQELHHRSKAVYSTFFDDTKHIRLMELAVSDLITYRDSRAVPMFFRTVYDLCADYSNIHVDAVRQRLDTETTAPILREGAFLLEWVNLLTKEATKENDREKLYLIKYACIAGMFRGGAFIAWVKEDAPSSNTDHNPAMEVFSTEFGQIAVHVHRKKVPQILELLAKAIGVQKVELEHTNLFHKKNRRSRIRSIVSGEHPFDPSYATMAQRTDVYGTWGYRRHSSLQHSLAQLAQVYYGNKSDDVTEMIQRYTQTLWE